MTARADVAILGGGIGGLALGILLRTRGLDAIVVERSRTDDPDGIAIILMSNGLTVLDGMGLGERVRDRGRSAFGVSLYTPDGEFVDQRPIEEHLCIRRADLVETLVDQLDERAIMRAEVSGLAFGDDGSVVAATLADGTHLKAGLFVGADGTHSLLREAMYPPSIVHPDQVHGWLATCRSPRIVERLAGTIMKVEQPGMVLGAVAITAEDVAWFLHYSTALYHPASRRGDDLARFVRETVGGWADPVPELIELTDFARSRLCRTPDMDAAPMWRRNTALIGDAAHPLQIMVGQGASTALEDAHALAVALQDWPGGAAPETAMARFEAERIAVAQDRLAEGRERVHALVATGETTPSDSRPIERTGA